MTSIDQLSPPERKRQREALRRRMSQPGLALKTKRVHIISKKEHRFAAWPSGQVPSCEHRGGSVCLFESIPTWPTVAEQFANRKLLCGTVHAWWLCAMGWETSPYYQARAAWIFHHNTHHWGSGWPTASPRHHRSRQRDANVLGVCADRGQNDKPKGRRPCTASYRWCTHQQGCIDNPWWWSCEYRNGFWEGKRISPCTTCKPGKGRRSTKNEAAEGAKGRRINHCLYIIIVANCQLGVFQSALSL